MRYWYTVIKKSKLVVVLSINIDGDISEKVISRFIVPFEICFFLGLLLFNILSAITENYIPT